MKISAKKEINKQMKRVIALGVMVTICTVSVFSMGTFSHEVTVDVDSSIKTSHTFNTDTYKILEQMGIGVSKNDTINRKDEENGDIKLEVKRAFSIPVSKSEEEAFVMISSGTVKDAIEKSGIVLDDNDLVNYPLNEDLNSEMKIVITPRVEVKVNFSGEEKNCLVPLGKVSEAIDYLGIKLASTDIVSSDINSDVYEGMNLTINKVEYREVTKKEEIPFNTVVKYSNLINGNDSEVKSTGKKGEREIVVREKVVDGVVTDSQEIINKVIVAPVDEVVLKNSNASSSKTSSGDDKSYENVLEGSATAYTAESGARTSTGSVPTQGVTVAVNPDLIPYGKKLLIKSTDGSFVWNGVSQDTGGALKRGSALVDIFMNSKVDCIKFGRKRVKVYVLNS